MLRPCTSALCALAVLTACGGSAGSTAGESTTTAPPRDLTPTDASAFTGLVDIGDGRHVFLRCAGTGTPTVIFESGDESKIATWNAVQPAVAERTTTCAYNRLGNHPSDSPTKACRGLADLRGDLEALLRVRGLRGPYVLIGTSSGGFLMADFAYEHPTDVAGIVPADTPRALIPAEAPPELLAGLRCDAATNKEHRDYVAIETDVWSRRRPVGDIPMTVITNDYQGAGRDDEQQANVAAQQGWLVLSPQARQIIVTSGHDVPQNEPELTVREILRVLDAVPD